MSADNISRKVLQLVIRSLCVLRLDESRISGLSSVEFVAMIVFEVTLLPSPDMLYTVNSTSIIIAITLVKSTNEILNLDKVYLQ